MPYGGNCSTVGGFIVFGGNDFGSGKPKDGGIFSAVMQYGGNVLAVGDFSFFGRNTSAVGGITKIWRYITGTAHQGGNFTAGKILKTIVSFSLSVGKDYAA